VAKNFALIGASSLGIAGEPLRINEDYFGSKNSETELMHHR
jgi:hypothetical protein